MNDFVLNKLPKWILFGFCSMLLLGSIVTDATTNKLNKSMSPLIIGFISFVLGVYTLVTLMYKPSNTCDPTDDERTLAGGEGVLTFEPRTMCAAASCNTTAGYTLTDTGICVKNI